MVSTLANARKNSEQNYEPVYSGIVLVLKRMELFVILSILYLKLLFVIRCIENGRNKGNQDKDKRQL